MFPIILFHTYIIKFSQYYSTGPAGGGEGRQQGCRWSIYSAASFTELDFVVQPGFSHLVLPATASQISLSQSLLLSNMVRHYLKQWGTWQENCSRSWGNFQNHPLMQVENAYKILLGSCPLLIFIIFTILGLSFLFLRDQMIPFLFFFTLYVSVSDLWSHVDGINVQNT